MKVILAQGNLGEKYANTRHNVAWQAIDMFAKLHEVEFSDKPKFFAYIGEYIHAGEKVLLIKPTTFYNETGRSLSALRQFYKITSNDILVLHDELALPFGTLRTRQGGSDAGNNGIKSINAHGGDQTYRIRIGIRNDVSDRTQDVDFVLGRFSESEQTTLQTTVLPTCVEIIDSFIAGHLTATTHVTD